MARFTIWGKEYEVPEKFTLGETADVEEICGGETAEGRRIRRTLATVWIAVRRVDPTAKFDDIRNLDWDEIEWVKDPEADGAASPDHSGNQGSSESTASTPGTSNGSTQTSGTPYVPTSGA